MIEIKKYIKWLKNRNLSPITINNYRYAIQQFNSSTFTTRQILDYIKKNLSRYEPKSLQSKLIAFTSYAKYKKVKIGWEKIAQIVPKVQKKFFATINHEELEQLKQVRFERRDNFYQRNNLLLDFLFYTGIRVSELVNLKVSDYLNGMLRIHDKGNKIRYVFLPPFLISQINPYSKDYYLFTNYHGKKLSVRIIEKIITKRTKLAGIQKRITPHSFRRSFATNLYNKGGKLETIQKQLGHSSLDTTMAYIHNDYETLFADYSKLWKQKPSILTSYANY